MGGCCFVLDTIGDLASVYRLASVAFVGGSLVANGGHNPLEAAQFGVPVVMGRSFENFREMVEAMQAQDAIGWLRGAEIGGRCWWSCCRREGRRRWASGDGGCLRRRRGYGADGGGVGGDGAGGGVD